MLNIATPVTYALVYIMGAIGVFGLLSIITEKLRNKN